MAFGFVEGKLIILSIACWVVQVATGSEVSGNCSRVYSIPCGTITLKNGEDDAMVPKLITSEKLYLPYIPELENIVKYRVICATPVFTACTACISNPCLNGGTCLETVHGFDCSCTPEFYGPTCDTKRCPGRWHFFDGSCYNVFRAKATFNSALGNCRDIHMEMGQVDLASIHNDQELEFILDLCHGLNDNRNFYWIGLRKSKAEEGAFVWSDGTPVHYTSWYPREPNDWSNTKECVEIKLEPGATRHVWHDAKCAYLNHYICKVTFNV